MVSDYVHRSACLENAADAITNSHMWQRLYQKIRQLSPDVAFIKGYDSYYQMWDLSEDMTVITRCGVHRKIQQLLPDVVFIRRYDSVYQIWCLSEDMKVITTCGVHQKIQQLLPVVAFLRRSNSYQQM